MRGSRGLLGGGADALAGEIDREAGGDDAHGIGAAVGQGEGSGEGGSGGEEDVGMGGLSNGEGEVVGEGEGVVELDAFDAELVEEVEGCWGDGGGKDEGVELAEGVAERWGGELDIGRVEEGLGFGEFVVDDGEGGVGLGVGGKGGEGSVDAGKEGRLGEAGGAAGAGGVAADAGGHEGIAGVVLAGGGEADVGADLGFLEGEAWRRAHWT